MRRQRSNVWFTCLALLGARPLTPPLAAQAPGPHTPPEDALVGAVQQVCNSCVTRDQSGAVRDIEIPFALASDQSLRSAARLTKLTNLCLRLTSNNASLTPEGIRSLAAAPSLRELTVACPRTLRPGLLASISSLTNLRVLTLMMAAAPTGEYHLLTNMVALEELHISQAPSFGESELLQLRQMPHLRNLRLLRTSVGEESLPIIRTFPALTNADVLTAAGARVAWSRPRP